MSETLKITKIPDWLLKLPEQVGDKEPAIIYYRDSSAERAGYLVTRASVSDLYDCAFTCLMAAIERKLAGEGVFQVPTKSATPVS